MKLRVSYSLLHQWQQGNIDRALLSYFHVPQETPPEYQEGRYWDKYVSDYIERHSRLPKEFGGDEVKNGRTQHRMSVDYSDRFELVGIFDLLEDTVITEIKSGGTSASAYARGHQVPMYLLLAQLKALPVEYARIIRYNQKTKKSDRAIIYPDDRTIERAKNYIDTLAPEVYDYFESNDLFRPEEEIQKILLDKIRVNKL